MRTNSIILGILLLCFIISLPFSENTINNSFSPTALLALLAGLVYESNRFKGNLFTVFLISGLSISITFVISLTQKEFENASINIYQTWPLQFIFFFSLANLMVNEDMVRKKQTEGMNILLTTTFVYWLFDNDGFQDGELPYFSAAGIGLIFLLNTAMKGFRKSAPSRISRLFSSILGTILMLIFSIDFVFNSFQNGTIGFSSDIFQNLYIGIQYFILGISAIYFALSIFLLFEIVPGRHNFFDAIYFQNLKNLAIILIHSQTKSKARFGVALFYIAFPSILFATNYFLVFMPRPYLIWVVLVSAPLLIHLYDIYFQNTTKENKAEQP